MSAVCVPSKALVLDVAELKTNYQVCYYELEALVFGSIFIELMINEKKWLERKSSYM